MSSIQRATPTLVNEPRLSPHLATTFSPTKNTTTAVALRSRHTSRKSRNHYYFLARLRSYWMKSRKPRFLRTLYNSPKDPCCDRRHFQLISSFDCFILVIFDHDMEGSSIAACTRGRYRTQQMRFVLLENLVIVIVVAYLLISTTPRAFSPLVLCRHALRYMI